MYQSEPHSTPANALQSIRSSCDRCRLQKLKCTVQTAEPDGPMVCERCVRAKVPCVFGRRRRASKRGADTSSSSSSTTSLKRQSTTPPGYQDPGILTPSSSASASTGDLVLGGTTPPPPPPPSSISQPQPPPGQAYYSSGGLETPLETLAECEQEATYQSAYHSQQHPWGHLTSAFPGGGLEGQHGGDSMLGWDWMDQDFSPDELHYLEPELLSATPPSASSDSPTPGTYQPATTDGADIMMDGSHSSNNSALSTASAAGRRLPALIAEMQRRLEKLENGSWLHESSARSFDRYPIGAVLQLSHEFGVVAGQVLGIAVGGTSSQGGPPALAAAAGGEGSGGGGRVSGEGTATSNNNNNSNNQNNNSNNTATVLLVLGGYLLLVRLYGLVLAHFRAHLHRIPSGATATIKTTATSSSGALRLGELPSGGALADVSRIHAALGMLLASLRGVEEQLGQGGEVARDMAVALLTQPHHQYQHQQQDGLKGLGEQVRSVKELLREKMGL
ncbi:hypothetical protein C7999DRAFT_14287 [Corynascus novoguineensis]|uniref:Zn(2)-C6 fungal-type domain-containing protein n=1 Tax=Corynascus novoguineensis TaxID=1126955 RepID=A0AAN7HJ77_9PEZI|nr:hypothetical protein C7999DRAFT_14287 [Corynascus novoguineensis]